MSDQKKLDAHVILTCVYLAVVVDKTTMFCCWETNQPGRATVHHSVKQTF